jgi:hypothetical protein
MARSAPPAAASSMRVGDGGLRSLVGSAKGGLLEPAATALAPDEDLLGLGTAGFAAGGGLLLPGAANFAPPRTLLTSRLGSPTLVNDRRFRIASWRSLSITADTTVAIFRPYGKIFISRAKRDVNMSSSAARGIGTFLGHRPSVTSSFHAEDSRSSGEDILRPRATQVPINSTAK